MRPGSWDGATTTDNVRVTVAGTVRPVKSVRIQSGMRDGDPRSDTSSWCVESTIEWADPALVTATSPHPFGTSAGDTWRGATEWLPKPGDEVVIETGDGALGKWWVQHRGVIDDTSGSIADGTARSTTVDRIEDLEHVVTMEPMLATMPALSASDGTRRVGLLSAGVVDHLLRAPGKDFVGWHSSPPVTWQTVAAATHLGSLWPDVGTTREAWGVNNGNRPQLHSFNDTLHFGHLHSRVLMDPPAGVSRSSIILTAAVPRANTSIRGEWRIDALNILGQGVYVAGVAGSQSIRFGVVGGSSASIADNNGGVRAGRFALYATTTALTLRFDDGREQTLNIGSSPWPAGAVGEVVIDADGNGFGWWMVEGVKTAGQRWDSLNAPQTARFRFRNGDYTRWIASRGMLQETASEWLQDQVDAELAAMWLDEDGVMQWAGRGVLDGQGVARTITSVRDVDDIQWAQKRRRLARSAVVAYKSPSVDRSYQADISRTLWQDDSVDVTPGVEEVIAVNVPDDQDWIGVDLYPRHLSSYSQAWDYYTTKSCYGGTQYRASDDSEQAWAQFLDCTMEKFNHRSFEVRFSLWASVSSLFRCRTRYPSNPNALMRVGASTLALRGAARVVWRDRAAGGAGGSEGRAEYVHDVGWRVQNSDGDVDSVLTQLRTAVSQLDGPRPYVTGLTIEHDPRLQIGDKIRVRDTEITGADFDILIQERDIDTEAMTETISGRCTLIRTEWVSGVSAHTESRHEPGGPTPITPSSGWTREAV